MPFAILYSLYRMAYILILAHMIQVLLQFLLVSLPIWILLQVFVPFLSFFNEFFHCLKGPTSPVLFFQVSHLSQSGTNLLMLLSDHSFVDHFDQGEHVIC
jgi:hypothetical protein